MAFLVNEQNVPVNSNIDINAISLCLDLIIIFQQDECFCSKLGLEVEHAKSNIITPLSQILVILSLASFCQSKAFFLVEDFSL